ncbi:haloacid dehalogenase superfamily, subfamily IA, variant 3 with third motif having DD or ED [Roseivivax lentus]|uniref:Haloacid dehalogenase superfamily, subfamily IA, variant 3 with third motif having DD or ED n=1 Tax=Roseivivax lentus TaxID=633194 RepID=A0A1N7LFN5_9RHOB|nr:HAD-IA family hydrolase [Roseivivax lentus]SIS72635.1 haloacid dehalogenase superfamily, subfamily IA, variant 3 with third motif having DD or ED [Roseivivax lentus]
MPALLLGSIGVLAETSDIQRRAFNQAFAEAGLDWQWDRAEYARLLTQSGGRDRIARYAETRGETVDATALHARKSTFFRAALERGLPLRPGVADTIAEARTKGWRLAFVTSTSAANVDAILKATHLGRETFQLVTTAADATASKPAPDIYVHALLQLETLPQNAIAVEDNPDGLRAAQAAGIPCIAFPGELHTASTFTGATDRLERLSLPHDLKVA